MCGAATETKAYSHFSLAADAVNDPSLFAAKITPGQGAQLMGANYTNPPTPIRPPVGIQMVDNKTGPDSQACHDALHARQSAEEHKLVSRFLQGFALGGVAGAGTGPGAFLSGLGGGAANVIAGEIDHATSPHPAPPDCQ